jgi:Domain of unknown function (DUF2804), C-terminal
VEGLPQRGPGVRDLDIPLPPDQMPLRRGTRPLKRWRYVGVYSPEVMVCVGEVRVGPMPQRFWAIAEPGRPVTERTSIAKNGLRMDGSRAQVETDDVRIAITLEEDSGVESVHPSGQGGYVWTRKQAGIPAQAQIRVGSRMYAIEAAAAVDETAGYHQRHTRWIWSAGVGRTPGGERVGWNLVAGVNDSARNSERAVWVDGEPFEPGRVEFADDLSTIAFADGGELHFTEWSAREDRTNLLIVRSTYRQPFGTFTGSFPGLVQLAEGFGVVEVHDVYW